ncbi:MAG: molybdate ABC transporter substrate-binding protein, partial [Defluviitaleaceae bacterium]|nr:molybdate ABC transporter substrate-binding protein [Defluviitaleaceae bacterium]
SGALQGQIEAGADIDVFFSAAMGQINALDSQGLLYGESQIVVRNSLALVVPIGSTLTINGFADLASDEVAQIGVGDEAMPAGNFAREVFEIQGVLDEANAKSVLGSNVAQILTWVELGEVDAGVIFMTDAATSDLVRVVEVADPVWHSPSVNPVAIVADSQNIEAAGAFVDFLFTPAARAIFEQYGFTMFN